MQVKGGLGVLVTGDSCLVSIELHGGAGGGLPRLQMFP